MDNAVATSTTEIITSIKLVLALLTPMLGACLVSFSGKKPNVREMWSVLAAVITFLLVFSMTSGVLAGKTYFYEIFRILPGITISLRADALSMVFALIASFLWIMASFYSMGYMRAHKGHSQTRFNTYFAIAIFGAMGVAFSDNLFTLYLFYEIVSVSTYPLVAHNQDKEAYGGGKKYMVYLTTMAKGMILPAMAIIYVMTGSLDFPHNIYTGMLPDDADSAIVTMLFIFCLFGFAKNGVMPFHHWLPGAMVAPTPVSALLHAVAVVKAGVFSTVRVFLYVFGVNLMDLLNLGITTAYFVGFTIIMASVIAMTKDNLKARLAYSTVSQLSYIILGVCLLTPHGIQGGIIHIANHAFSKITLFFCAGAILIASHKKDISEMDGLGRAMPFTYAAFAIASLSMIGAPPVAGFITKWELLMGTIEAGSFAIILILLASTLLNVCYFAPVVYRGFFYKPPSGVHYDRIQEAPVSMLIPLCCTAIISVIIGFYPDFFMNFVSAVL